LPLSNQIGPAAMDGGTEASALIQKYPSPPRRATTAGARTTSHDEPS